MRELRLDTVRGSIAALRHGDAGGAPVLALHGWLDNAASFVPLLAHLPGCDVVAIDLPGHGHSAHRPDGSDYVFADWLLDVLAVLDELGWPRCRLLGHSLGGAIAALVAVATPERIERLGLIESAGPLSGDAAGAAQRLCDAISARRRVDTGPLRTFPDIATAVRTRMHSNGLSEASARLLVERGIAPVEGGFAWRSDRRLTLPTPLRAEETTVEAWLRAIDCPVSVVAAERAPPYFPEHQRESRLSCVRDVRNVVLPGGHHLHMETPAPVGAVMAPFLAEPTPTA